MKVVSWILAAGQILLLSLCATEAWLPLALKKFLESKLEYLCYTAVCFGHTSMGAEDNIETTLGILYLHTEKMLNTDICAAAV